MGIFRGIFGGRRRGKDSTVRVLEHPRDLGVGDILKFGFASQQGISNQSFTVRDINTCDLGGEAHKKVLFSIEGAELRCRLAVVEDGAGERLEVGRTLMPDDVAQVFERDAFIDLLDSDTGVHHALERAGEPAFLAGWTACEYRQEAGHNAYVYAGNYRARPMPLDADEGDAFSYYFLMADDRQFALEVQVYDGGRTEVYLLCYLRISKIEELWPAGRS